MVFGLFGMGMDVKKGGISLGTKRMSVIDVSCRQEKSKNNEAPTRAIFPNEIICSIVNELYEISYPARAFADYGLVSRSFYGCVQPLLFTHASFVARNASDSPCTRLALFEHLLAQDPWKASLVRSLEIKFPTPRTVFSFPSYLTSLKYLALSRIDFTQLSSATPLPSSLHTLVIDSGTGALSNLISFLRNSKGKLKVLKMRTDWSCTWDALEIHDFVLFFACGLQSLEMAFKSAAVDVGPSHAVEEPCKGHECLETHTYVADSTFLHLLQRREIANSEKLKRLVLHGTASADILQVIPSSIHELVVCVNSTKEPLGLGPVRELLQDEMMKKPKSIVFVDTGRSTFDERDAAAWELWGDVKDTAEEIKIDVTFELLHAGEFLGDATERVLSLIE
ncbi:hypothetical protein BT69DRAFT_1302917 [Atractiella rhizophila]|nr:hypothetical protein BT69DRAFT_1302917 [Atractiella rhizophila]